jgi:hypothetical protein
MSKKLEQIFTDYSNNSIKSSSQFKYKKKNKSNLIISIQKYLIVSFLLFILGYLNLDLTNKIFDMIINYPNTTIETIIDLVMKIFTNIFSFQSIILILMIYVII